jgi:predicted NUDIX family phosphoesterase
MGRWDEADGAVPDSRVSILKPVKWREIGGASRYHLLEAVPRRAKFLARFFDFIRQEVAVTQTSQTTEQVLVVPTLLFHEIGVFQGFTPDVDRYVVTLLDPLHTSYRPRDEVEDDPSYKQLIPYCIFRHAGRVFHYTRGNSQGEARLHAKRSIGVGGHVSLEDEGNEHSAYHEGMRREIAEEVFLETGFLEYCVGLINDDSTEVGRVHLGIVHLFDLDEPKVRPRETSMKETGFADPADLIAHRDRFETWSQICLEHLFGA